MVLPRGRFLVSVCGNSTSRTADIPTSALADGIVCEEEEGMCTRDDQVLPNGSEIPAVPATRRIRTPDPEGLQWKQRLAELERIEQSTVIVCRGGPCAGHPQAVDAQSMSIKSHPIARDGDDLL